MPASPGLRSLAPRGWYMRRERKRGGGGESVSFQGRPRSRASSSRLCPTVSCRVCCCFAEGLWEVLALRGQQRTPPSSCFDRHPTLTQTFSLFHFICGPSNGPFFPPPQKLQNWGGSMRLQYQRQISLSRVRYVRLKGSSRSAYGWNLHLSRCWKRENI